jgi:hypothetical protein
MNLIAIEYKLDEWELPEHRFLTGSLDIEIDNVDGLPYIWAFDLKIWNSGTNIVVEHYYQHGRQDNHIAAVHLKNELHRDRELMDRIYDKCASDDPWD